MDLGSGGSWDLDLMPFSPGWGKLVLNSCLSFHWQGELGWVFNFSALVSSFEKWAIIVLLVCGAV